MSDQLNPIAMPSGQFEALLNGGLDEVALSTHGLAGLGSALEPPRVDLRLELYDATRGVRVLGALVAGIVVLGVPREPVNDTVDVVIAQPAALPAQLARLIGLGPRPSHRVEGALRLEQNTVELLRAGASDEGSARAVCEDLAPIPVRAATALQAALKGQRIHWRLECSPSGGAAAAIEACEVIDAGPAGVWMLMTSPLAADADSNGTIMVTATPRTVWRFLVEAIMSSVEQATDTTTAPPGTPP